MLFSLESISLVVDFFCREERQLDAFDSDSYMLESVYLLRAVRALLGY
jgi:hypothetical protein